MVTLLRMMSRRFEESSVNRIKIMFGRLKDWRQVATRYDRCTKGLLSAVAVTPAVMFWPLCKNEMP